MAIRILDYLNDDESKALSDFLVEVLGLEQAITYALERFYAVPERRALFSEQFLDRMTLGMAAQRLAPVLDHFSISDQEREKERNRLDEIVKVRNIVAHSLPTSAYQGDGDDFDEYHVYETKQGPMRVEELEMYAVMALKLRARISTLKWPTE